MLEKKRVSLHYLYSLLKYHLSLQPPPHLAPEVVSGHRFTKTSDCFGLGITSLYVLLGRAATINDADPRLVPTDPAWNILTHEAKMFVRSLMNADHTKRLTAPQAIESPWLKRWGVQMVGPHVEKPADPEILKKTKAEVHAIAEAIANDARVSVSPASFKSPEEAITAPAAEIHDKEPC
jgi:serine/threonine protein kinase